MRSFRLVGDVSNVLVRDCTRERQTQACDLSAPRRRVKNNPGAALVYRVLQVTGDR